MEFTRSQMESLVEDLVQRTVLPCQKALLDANLKPFQVKEVILVGGMTRMPKIHEVVESIFGRAPNITVNPDEAIAMGAAIQVRIYSIFFVTVEENFILPIAYYVKFREMISSFHSFFYSCLTTDMVRNNKIKCI
ncbi:unnamed protein product [Trichobilharzia regenti]|nr:unnamed protein product [Trichobilharzia regenti]